MRCASPREYYPMLAPPCLSDHIAGHQLAVGRDEMILIRRFCQPLKLSPNKTYQLHSAVLDSRSSPPLYALHYHLVFTNIVKLTNAHEISLFSPHLVKGRSLLIQKVQCQAFSTKKKCIASTRHKPLKNNIKPALTSPTRVINRLQ